jgi:hypothetical protein
MTPSGKNEPIVAFSGQTPALEAGPSRARGALTREPCPHASRRTRRLDSQVIALCPRRRWQASPPPSLEMPVAPRPGQRGACTSGSRQARPVTCPPPLWAILPPAHQAPSISGLSGRCYVSATTPERVRSGTWLGSDSGSTVAAGPTPPATPDGPRGLPVATACPPQGQYRVARAPFTAAFRASIGER